VMQNPHAHFVIHRSGDLFDVILGCRLNEGRSAWPTPTDLRDVQATRFCQWPVFLCRRTRRQTMTMTGEDVAK
jgi:hypothetical protein